MEWEAAKPQDSNGDSNSGRTPTDVDRRKRTKRGNYEGRSTAAAAAALGGCGQPRRRQAAPQIHVARASLPQRLGWTPSWRALKRAAERVALRAGVR
jgi:hypothetical protein